jgi:hypothetical protein
MSQKRAFRGEPTSKHNALDTGLYQRDVPNNVLVLGARVLGAE